MDYLADEVLDRQPPDVRRFLLDTSILDRLSAPLCDAVTGRTDGKAMLESLERQNLFVVPLDDQRRWYRYHHLFADVLHARLLDERPDDVSELHRRASDWYDQAGDPEAAVRHALAAGDVDLAADRVELAIPELLRERREARHPPLDRRAARRHRAEPAGARCRVHRRPGGEQRVRAASRSDCETSNSSWRVRSTTWSSSTRPSWRACRRSVQTYRAALALVGGDLAGTVEHADRALARAADDDHLTTASASALVGLASWTAATWTRHTMRTGSPPTA